MITVSGHVISVSEERKKNKIVYFLFGKENGANYGTYVDFITGSNYQDHVAKAAIRKEQEINVPDPYQTMQFLFDTNIGSGTYDAVRVALKDLGGQYVTLGNSLQLNVTYPTQVNPEDIEGEMRKRVDAIQGSGTFDTVKFLLKNIGYDKTVIERKSEITL